VDELDLPLWLAEMARQAEQISRDTRSAVEMVISLEPGVQQSDAAAAAIAPSSVAVDVAQRQTTGMTALHDATPAHTEDPSAAQTVRPGITPGQSQRSIAAKSASSATQNQVLHRQRRINTSF
jgi:hypothetical protein